MLKQVRFLNQDLTDGLLAMFEQNIEFLKEPICQSCRF